MHDIDRTQLDHGRHHEQFLGNLIGAVAGGELEVPLTEVQELELASELLEVTNEEELEQFLGDVFHSVGNAVGQFVRSDTGWALGGILKDAAGKALPAIGQAVGQQFGGSTGADWGGRIGQAAGSHRPSDSAIRARRAGCDRDRQRPRTTPRPGSEWLRAGAARHGRAGGALHGGQLHAGPGVNGGFEVRARIPLDAGTASANRVLRSGGHHFELITKPYGSTA